MSCLFLPCFLLENHLPPGFLSLNNTILPVGSTTNLLHEVPSLIPRCCLWPTSWSPAAFRWRFFHPFFWKSWYPPSRELTYPPQNGILKMIFLWYVNSLEGTSIFQTGTWCVKLFWNWNLFFFEGGGGHRCIFLFITVLFLTQIGFAQRSFVCWPRFLGSKHAVFFLYSASQQIVGDSKVDPCAICRQSFRQTCALCIFLSMAVSYCWAKYSDLSQGHPKWNPLKCVYEL